MKAPWLCHLFYSVFHLSTIKKCIKWQSIEKPIKKLWWGVSHSGCSCMFVNRHPILQCRLCPSSSVSETAFLPMPLMGNRWLSKCLVRYWPHRRPGASSVLLVSIELSPSFYGHLMSESADGILCLHSLSLWISSWQKIN